MHTNKEEWRWERVKMNINELTDEELLQFDVKELNNYIIHQTKGMSIRKKMQFGNTLIARIKQAKKDNKNI